MANVCFFFMHVRGEDLELFEKSFFSSDGERTADRMIPASNIASVRPGTHIEDGVLTLTGSCRWSVHSSMMCGLGEGYCSLQELSFITKTEVEVFSEENDFMEHLLIKNGLVIVDETEDLIDKLYDSTIPFEEWLEEEGLTDLEPPVTQDELIDGEILRRGGFEYDFTF